MTLDNIDIKILREFHRLNGNDTTTWNIMKNIFKEGKERENQVIKYRIKKMSELGLFIVHGKPSTFSMIKDFVIFKDIKFPDKIRKGVCLKICNKWEQYEL